MTTGTWWRIEAPHFCAGFRLNKDDLVDHGAPILRWLYGKSLSEVMRICQRQQWLLNQVS